MKLTEHQMMMVKSMAEFAEASANQIFHIMQNHGLDKIEGCYLRMSVDPTRHFTTMNIVIGEDGSDFGRIDLARGENSEKFQPSGKNSPEYELLFADEAVRKAMEKAVRREKPLPPDGYWVGVDNNTYSVDCGEWDVNDSLS